MRLQQARGERPARGEGGEIDLADRRLSGRIVGKRALQPQDLRARRPEAAHRRRDRDAFGSGVSASAATRSASRTAASWASEWSGGSFGVLL